MQLYIDTDKNTYYLQLKGLAKANLFTDEAEIIIVELKVLCFSFNIYPFRQEKTSIKIKKQKKTRTKHIGFKRILRLIKTFRVKKFYMDIDTGNYITNAKLYPLFALLNHKYGGFRVNFKNRNSMLLSVENRPIRIIKAFINN
jgi:hypothetical protein